MKKEFIGLKSKEKILSLLVKKAIIWIFLPLFSSLFFLCKGKKNALRPYGYMREEYLEEKYIDFSNEFMKFKHSSLSKIEIIPHKKHWFNLIYPHIKATIYLTYFPVNKNLEKLVYESELSVKRHQIKASYIKEKSFFNPKSKNYGKIYQLGGESASNLQFYLTDGVKHFLSGILYFDHYVVDEDFLLPKIKYIKKNIKKLLESLTWK